MALVALEHAAVGLQGRTQTASGRRVPDAIMELVVEIPGAAAIEDRLSVGRAELLVDDAKSLHERRPGLRIKACREPAHPTLQNTDDPHDFQELLFGEGRHKPPGEGSFEPFQKPLLLQPDPGPDSIMGTEDDRMLTVFNLGGGPGSRVGSPLFGETVAGGSPRARAHRYNLRVPPGLPGAGAAFRENI